MGLPTDGQLAEICAATYSATSYAWSGDGDERLTRTQVGEYTVVAYRGTTLNGEDILRDIRFLPWWNSRVGTCPAGFLKGVANVIDKLIVDLAEIARAGKLVLTGHSLGGTEGLITTGWLVDLGLIPAACVVFEPARSGFGQLMSLLTRVPVVRWYHDGNDPVPDVPWPYRLPPNRVAIGRPSWRPILCHRIGQVIADMKAAGIP